MTTYTCTACGLTTTGEITCTCNAPITAEITCDMAGVGGM